MGRRWRACETAQDLHRYADTLSDSNVGLDCGDWDTWSLGDRRGSKCFI